MKRVLSLMLTGLMLFAWTGLRAGDAARPDAVSAASTSVVHTVQDVRDLQHFLLEMPVGKTLSGKDYDLNDDGRWDVVDLCLMKQQLRHQQGEASETNVIVVYFSRTGNTERIASCLVELTGADSYVIRAEDPYTDEDIAYNNADCRANREQDDKTVRPAIADPLRSLDGYGIVFLGYPIWWGQEPRIIDTFLESYDFSEKTVIPFCTSASSGIAASERNISGLVPIGEQLPGKRFSASADMDAVRAWYDTLALTTQDSEP